MFAIAPAQSSRMLVIEIKLSTILFGCAFFAVMWIIQTVQGIKAERAHREWFQQMQDLQKKEHLAQQAVWKAERDAEAALIDQSLLLQEAKEALEAFANIVEEQKQS